MDYSMARITSKFSRLIFRVVWLFWLAVLLLSSGCDRDVAQSDASQPDVSPPDLSNCTRLEIRYPRIMEDFFPSAAYGTKVLSPEDIEYIQSFEFFTVTDPERIKAFAREVNSGTYGGSLHGVLVFTAVYINVDCYRNDERLMSLTVIGDSIRTEDDREFKYPRGKLNLENIEPHEIQPFKWRYQCASNMQRTYAAGSFYRIGKVSAYPDPAEWCDVVMRDRTSYVSEAELRGDLKCPVAGEGKCHYAMNPHCEPNSPPDAVLLFETEGGWNESGGPALFTFDNHDPKGGCVLLNDGTVKFIRTREELQQLRWK